MADIGATRTPGASELLYARSAIVTHAKAFGLQAIDLVCVNYRDEDVLRDECTRGTARRGCCPSCTPV